MKSEILAAIFKHHKSNKSCDRQKYPQTWWIVSKMKPSHRRIIETLCELFGGHELSETEWGYHGGDKVDRWCRWCNKMIVVPKTSILFRNETARRFIKSFDQSNKFLS